MTATIKLCQRKESDRERKRKCSKFFFIFCSVINGKLWFLLLLCLFIPFPFFLSLRSYLCVAFCEVLQICEEYYIEGITHTLAFFFSIISEIFFNDTLCTGFYSTDISVFVKFIHKKNFTRHHQNCTIKMNQNQNEWLLYLLQ